MSYLVKAFEQHDKSEWRFDNKEDAEQKYNEVSGLTTKFDAGYLYRIDGDKETLLLSWDDSYGFDVATDDYDGDDWEDIPDCEVCGGEFWDGGTSCVCNGAQCQCGMGDGSLPELHSDWCPVKEYGFYAATPEGNTMHVSGDPNMSEETLQALGQVMDLAAKQFGGDAKAGWMGNVNGPGAEPDTREE